VDQSVSQSSSRRGLHYSVFSPVHYEQNYAYPLIVWLHGTGDDENQLARVMPLISMRNYVAIAPRGISDAAGNGCSWPDSDYALGQAQQRVFDCIDEATIRFHVAPKRIFLAGLQCGGSMAFRVAMSAPHRFGGVLSLAGGFPQENAPLSRINELRDLPLFIAHGRESTYYPVDQACHDLRLFHVAGMCVTLRQYPCGDEVHVQMLSDMDKWMMEQVTGCDLTKPRQSFPLRPGESN
jgi:phospholipase/carboxylesterase